MKQDPLQIGEMLEPGIRSMGYELVGVEYQGGDTGGGLLRVYIDSEQGISAEDCQKVSYQVSGVLDVKDPIPGHYTLEISSPGLDRPLFRPQDFERFAGQLVRVHARYPIDGQRKFKGRLRGLAGDNVVIEQEGQEISLAFDEIEKARLVPEF
ncbi:MAG: ribosome maturation factor RimP [Gammaproteobacteria bacterium]|jgi:ribosome maturation factor RimP|nr:ribosome maturation factor RimP [Gammaproteobacteria bacterium]